MWGLVGNPEDRFSHNEAQMLLFQFAQFSLLTETVAVFATYVLGYIGSFKMKIFLAGQGVRGFFM